MREFLRIRFCHTLSIMHLPFLVLVCKRAGNTATYIRTSTMRIRYWQLLCTTVSRWDRLLVFGACNVAALVCFVICFALLPILGVATRKFAILFVFPIPLPLVLNCFCLDLHFLWSLPFSTSLVTMHHLRHKHSYLKKKKHAHPHTHVACDGGLIFKFDGLFLHWIIVSCSLTVEYVWLWRVLWRRLPVRFQANASG